MVTSLNDKEYLLERQSMAISCPYISYLLFKERNLLLVVLYLYLFLTKNPFDIDCLLLFLSILKNPISPDASEENKDIVITKIKHENANY